MSVDKKDAQFIIDLHYAAETTSFLVLDDSEVHSGGVE